MENSKGNKRVFEGVEEDEISTKRLKEDILDDSDEEVAEFAPPEEEICCFIKSFEEEITTAEPTLDLASDSSDCGESRTDLCFLLEATDDELGLPPTAGCSPTEFEGGHEQSSNEAEEVGEFWEVPTYDDSYGYGFGLGFGETDDGDNEYVALDGLFDHSDMGFAPGGPYSRSSEMAGHLESQ